MLVFNHHHIISDGVSVDIILKELSEFYQANLENRSPKLAKLPIQYVDFAAWQKSEFKKRKFGRCVYHFFITKKSHTNV